MDLITFLMGGGGVGLDSTGAAVSMPVDKETNVLRLHHPHLGPSLLTLHTRN